MATIGEMTKTHEEINQECETRSAIDDVPGAGVNPEKVRVPRKRLKNAFRKFLAQGGKEISFKEYCRTMADDNAIMDTVGYLSRKRQSSYQRPARDARKDRVRMKAAERKRKPVEPTNNRQKRR